MRTHLLGAALFAVSLLFPLLCPAQSVALLGGRPLEIPFQLHSGYLVIVEGSIGPFGHLKFILDTGTTRTCIDRGLARQLALPLEAESVFRFDNQVRLNSTHLASLTLGPLQAENFSVNVADLSHVGWNFSGLYTGWILATVVGQTGSCAEDEQTGVPR